VKAAPPARPPRSGFLSGWLTVPHRSSDSSRGLHRPSRPVDGRLSTDWFWGGCGPDGGGHDRADSRAFTLAMRSLPIVSACRPAPA
jgi:hypothetical protein